MDSPRRKRRLRGNPLTHPVRLPNFLLLGAAKAGTTALYDYLRQHPDVYMSPLKETNYFAFAGQRVDHRGPGDAATINFLSITRASAYSAQFASANGERAVGEASPLYLYDPAVPERVGARLPDARLIAVLRQPVDRAYSAFLHARRDQREPICDFVEALRCEDRRVADGWEHLWHYRRMGCYAEQLERWYARFPSKQILVLLYDDFCARPVETMAMIFRFLGVDDSFVPDMTLRRNSRPSTAAALQPALRSQLLVPYHDDLARLEKLLSRDLSAWWTDEEEDRPEAPTLAR